MTPERVISVTRTPETDVMSASYHEIFDNPMPLAERLGEGHDGEGDVDSLLLCCDNDTALTTEYLTTKLVEDSLKWQKEGAGDLSPRDSPLRKRLQAFPAMLSDDLKTLSLKNPPKTPKLDPKAVDDIERHARYLAACVDSMVENLSGVLHSASALTVNTLETYRDGVCKTCDEVDSNIKSMYQLMAKVEELNKSMTPAYRLGDQVKELKQLLDLYETNSSTS